MKRTSFKNKPRKPPQRSAFKTPSEGKKRPVTKKKPVKRSKLPSVKTMRNKCDKLLTPIIKKMYPYCILTGEPTEVAHHAIKKSTSSALRYHLPNLIPLTHKAHMRLHSDEILWTGRLVTIKGLDWWAELEEKKNEYTKTDVHFYIENHKRLQDILDSL